MVRNQQIKLINHYKNNSKKHLYVGTHLPICAILRWACANKRSVIGSPILRWATHLRIYCKTREPFILRWDLRYLKMGLRYLKMGLHYLKMGQRHLIIYLSYIWNCTNTTGEHLKLLSLNVCGLISKLQNEDFIERIT